MSQIVKKHKSVTLDSGGAGRAVSDPFAELNKFFENDPLSREECPDIIAWYGVSLRPLIPWLNLHVVSLVKIN